MNWIETVGKNQEYCVINSGKSTKYFKLQRGARQGNPKSAYLFILTLEVLFSLIKNHEFFEGLEIFDHHFLHSAYADGTTFFKKTDSLVLNLLKPYVYFHLLVYSQILQNLKL